VKPPPSATLVSWSAYGEAPPALAGATLHQRGLLEPLFATASADGTVAAVMLDSERPGVVAVARGDGKGGALAVERRDGNLVAGTSPLVGRSDEAADEVHLDELATGATYRAALRITSADAGMAAPADPSTACCGWWERTWWRVAADRPGDGILRVTSHGSGQWTVIDWYGPDAPTPRWRVVRRATDGLALVAAALVTPDGARALVQLVNRTGPGRLVAYDTATGEVAWQVDTASTVAYYGALATTGDGKAVVSILLDPHDCADCERAELRDVATGALVRDVRLADSSVLSRGGPVGVETDLGIAGDELWLRFHRRAGGRDSLKAQACTYDVHDLRDGRRRAADPAWAAALEACAPPMFLLPLADGVLGVQLVDATRLEITRFARAP
jgi:hypothetical protein